MLSRPLTVLFVCAAVGFAADADQPAGSQPPDYQQDAEAQPAVPAKPAGPVRPVMPEERRWYHMTLPVIGTSSLPSGTFEPLSRSEKVKYAVKHTIGPGALIDRAVLAGFNQMRDHPDEWPGGMEGYARRYGYRMTRLAVRNAVLLGADVAFGTDPRYDRCDCSGALPRIGHAFRRVIIARKDNGGEMFNFGRVGGAYAGSFVAYRLYPSQYHDADRAATSASMYLATRGVTNVVREFWPEIHRIIKIGPRPTY